MKGMRITDNFSLSGNKIQLFNIRIVSKAIVFKMFLWNARRAILRGDGNVSCFKTLAVFYMTVSFYVGELQRDNLRGRDVSRFKTLAVLLCL